MTAPNADKINRVVSELKRVRAAGPDGLPVGWSAGEVTPPDAHHMERMGEAVVTGERKEGRGVPGKARVKSAAYK